MTPILITLAVCLPVIAVMLAVYVRVQRRHSPDLLRFKVLRVLLCVVLACGGLALGAAALAAKPGEPLSAARLLPAATLLVVASAIALQMQQCRRNFRGKQ